MSGLNVDVAGEGPDLVLLHGWGMHSGVWTELIPALARRFRVHTIDLPGHGRSAGIAAPDFEGTVDLVAANVPDGARVCGWSLGALLAQRLVQRGAARVSRLVLVSATPCFTLRPGWKHAIAVSTLEAFAAWLAEDRDATLARFVALNALDGAREREAIRAFTGRLAERGIPAGAALAAGLVWLRDTDLRADAGRIAVPTLLVHGARDQLVPVEAGRWLAQAIPGARMHELADAAHLPFFTHRDAFLAALEAFVG